MLETTLIQLPNGDLHRGIHPELASADPNVEILPQEFAHPLNKAVSSILLAAKGSKVLTCLWCGLQFDSQFAEKDVREHLKDQHKNVVEPSADAAVLMANLAEAQRKLAEANA